MKAILPILLLMHANAWAQDTLFTADLHLMTRGEIRNGGMTYKNTDEQQDSKSAFILDRVRLSLGYQRNWLEAKAAVQHVGTWGHEGSSNVNVYEAWGKVKASFGLFAQIGRLALRYDDERIIGSDDWVMASMTHDALRLGYEGYGHKVHGILCYNQNMRATSSPGSYYADGSRPYKTMQTLWYHYDVPKVPLGISLLMMNIGMQAGVPGGTYENAPHTEWQTVLGGYVKCTPRYFSIEGSYYRQTGRDERTAKLDAWMASAKVVYIPNKTWAIKAGYDHLSGDDYVAVVKPGGLGMPLHEVCKGFNPVYGSHHKFYGAMDFFYLSTYVNGFTPGLQNAYIGAFYEPIKQLSLKVNYHYLATGTKLNGLSSTLGHEIEVEAAYMPARDIRIAAGYSYMTGTETMEKLKRATGDGNLRWAWLSLNVMPRLFSAKW